MKILITAPSLNTSVNVSGVSAVVNTIIANNPQHVYMHYLLGRPDGKLNQVNWLITLFKQLILFPWYLKKNKIQIVHQNLPFNPKGLLRESIINAWCKILGVPVLLHLHGGLFLAKKPSSKIYLYLTNFIFNNNVIVVLSDLEQKLLADLYNQKGSFVLPNCVDYKCIHTENKQLVFTKPNFLFIGRIHESKGIEDIMIALRLLKNRGYNFKFTLCGSGPLAESIISEAENILKNDFTFLGVVSGVKKIETLRNADFFVLPSRYGEGLPIALLESMAAGAIPVVTDDASLKYVIQDGYNGFRVEKYNPESIADKVAYAIEHPDLCKEVSVNATNMIKDKFDISSYINYLNNIYTKL